MKKWIVFRADKNQPGSLERQYAHTGALTRNLCEYFDCSNGELPKLGYRPSEYIRLAEAIDPQFPLASTHSRKGNWEVVRVETYTPDIPVGMSFDMIVVCTCQYNPIDAPLKPLPKIQISPDSFGGDVEAYQRYMGYMEQQ